MRRKTKFKRRVRLYTKLGVWLLIILALVLGLMKNLEKGPFSSVYMEREDSKIHILKPEMEVALLTENPYSRPGTQTERIKNIVIHYVGNPGTSAEQNRNYFENLKKTGERRASSHFIVGLEGEIVQCVPTAEVAYASNNRNRDTISIETCHPKADGRYTEATYESMVQLTAWLCEKFDLTEEDVIRHYDVTGKICPKYFVEDEEAWKAFKKDIRTMLGEK